MCDNTQAGDQWHIKQKKLDKLRLGILGDAEHLWDAEQHMGQSTHPLALLGWASLQAWGRGGAPPGASWGAAQPSHPFLAAAASPPAPNQNPVTVCAETKGHQALKRIKVEHKIRWSHHIPLQPLHNHLLHHSVHPVWTDPALVWCT